MVQIAPFKGWRYSGRIGKKRTNGVGEISDISSLCSPPYDVISPDEKRSLFEKSKYNASRLELAEGSFDPTDSNCSFNNSKETWDSWVLNKALIKDEIPAVYVLEQEFKSKDKSYNRVSFIVEMKLYDFDEKEVFPHEHTLPKTVDNVFNLINTSRINYSQVFGLFQSDDDKEYQDLVSIAKNENPVSIDTDSNGVISRLHAMTDEGYITRVINLLANRQVFIADGHHRYTVALRLKEHARREAAILGESETSQTMKDRALKTDSVMIALTNMDDPQLVILGYHRAVKATADFNQEKFMSALDEFFDIEQGAEEDLRARLNKCEQPAFIMGLKNQPLKLVSLKKNVDLNNHISKKHCIQWKKLDISVLHELIIKPHFKIYEDDIDSLKRITFSENEENLLARLENETSDAVFILRPTRMDQLRAITLEGEVLPQKSTFFYPKLPTGVVFRSMRENDV